MTTFPSGPVHAQDGAVTPETRIAIEAKLPPGETQVPKGASIVYRVSRTGDTEGWLDLVLRTWEPQRYVTVSTINENETYQRFGFRPGEAEVAVRVPVLGAIYRPPSPEYIQATIVPDRTDDYVSNVLDPVTTQLRNLEDDEAIVTISAAQDSIGEGDNAVFTLTRTGDRAAALTVSVRAEDPGGVMRGNHWDTDLPAEDFTKSVTFSAEAETATVSFPTRPNLRDTRDLTLTAEVLQDEDYDYWVGATFAADVTVTDDDTAPEFSLSVSPTEIDEGEEVTFTLTRHGDASQALEEVPFALRIGPDYRRFVFPDWVDPQDYGVSMAAGQSAQEFNFTVHHDDSTNRDFRFEAEFKLTRSVPDALVGEYFTVRGARKVGAAVENMVVQQVWVSSVGDQEFDDNDAGVGIRRTDYSEGQEFPFTITRRGTAEQIAEELVVHIRYLEVDHPDRVGSHRLPGPYYNPSDQPKFMTFPAGESTVGGTFVFAVDDVADPDTNSFTIYFPRVPYANYWSWEDRNYEGVGGQFRDNSRAVSIAVAEDEDEDEDNSTIEEGETAEFVLTRLGSTTWSFTLNVVIDDPGDFRRGNHWSNTPDRTVPVTFAAGSATATLSVPTQDDWRDIPNNTITATVPPSQDGRYRPAYETEGETSAAVTVKDNDVAPVITLAASAATVVEGQAASFTITRTNGDTRQSMRYLFGLFGPDDVQTRTHHWQEDETQLTLDVVTVDDDYAGPAERVYVAKILPLAQVPEGERSQYWTVTGSGQDKITVTDNDLPLVGVEEVLQSYHEGTYGFVRFVREGQSADELPVKYRITQNGNSVSVESNIGTVQTTIIKAGEENRRRNILLAWDDGDEDDTTVTVEVLADTEEYRIDPDHASATFTVTDRDPTPTLSISDATASEGAGQIEFRLSVESTQSVPSRREIRVLWFTSTESAESGTDYTGQVATLVIPPLATSATISVPLLDDALAEGEERFSLIVGEPTNVVLQDAQGLLVATGTITDDEPTVSLAAVNDTVEEGEDVVYEFTRTGTTTDSLTVYFRGGPSESLEQQSIDIPAGQSKARWTVSTEEDELDKPDLTYTAYVIPASWADQPHNYHSAADEVTVTVQDDDLPVVTIAADSEGVHESYNVDFTLTRVGRTDITLTVNVTVTRVGSLFPSGDPPSSVTFPVDSETVTLTVPTRGDSILEDHGSVTAAIAGGDDYEAGEPASAVTAVADNDRSGVSVAIAAAEAAVDEGENAVFTLTQTGGQELTALTVRVNVYEVRDHSPWSRNEEELAEFVELAGHTPHFRSGGARSLYSENAYDVSFAAGSNTATITIATEDEDHNDGNSYFRAIIPLSGSYRVDPFPGTAEVWVRDDDIPTVHITPEESEVVEGGDLAQFTFLRTGDTSTDLWVDFDHYRLIGFPEGDDRFPPSGLHRLRRAIFAGDASRALSDGYGLHLFAPINGREVYNLVQPRYCETVPGDCGTEPQYRVGSPNSSLIRVLNDAQGVRIEAEQDSVTEGEAATFTLTRHGGTPQGRQRAIGVSVRVTQNGQFIDGVPAQTVRFSGHPDVALEDASLTATLSISTLDDQVFEADGSIEVVVLSPPAAPLVGHFNYEVSSPGSAGVTVEDNDPPTVSISNASASEDAGTMDFTVSVPAAYGGMTVDWETSDGNGDDAATAGSDYEAASGQVVFSEGEPTRTISVNITDDSDAEGDEIFIVTLKDPVGLALPADPTATGTIVDDEAGGPGAGESPADDPEVTITATEDSVEEGEVASFTITRRQQTGGTQSDNWSDAPLSVSLALIQEGDFFSPSAGNFGGAFRSYDADSATAIVIIPAGQESATLNLTTDDDDVAEVDGAVTLTLAGGTGYAAGSPSIATTSVTDNDLGISISDATRGEEKSEITFTVSLSTAASAAVAVVASTRDGDATSTADVTPTSLGKDFEQKTETLTFDAGDTEKEFAVTLVNDTIDEHDEEFTVVLSAPSGNAGLLDASATGAIEDDDGPMIVGVHREGRTVNEDAEGPVIFRFEAAPDTDSTTTATERTIEVRWTVLPGTAKAGDDYAAVAASEKTEIPAGVTTKSVEVDLIDDSVFEVLEETFTFQLQNTINAVENTDHRSIEMSIRDDDGMRAEVVPFAQVVAEGEDAVFRVQLTQSVSSAPVEMTYSVVGTAGPLDYVAPSGSLTIPAGESVGFITISTLADHVVDPGETLGVVLNKATSNGREVITPGGETPRLVRILDSNTLSASIASSTPGKEGDDVEFTVRLSFAFDETVRVDWETEDVQGQGTQATSGEDYTSSSGSVDIAAGDTSATFEVATLEDSLFEGDEVFGAKLTSAARVSGGNARTEVPLGASSIVATITDDDAQPTAITLTAAPASVKEGDGEQEFTVTGALTGSSRLTGDVEIALKVEGSVVVNEDADDTETPTLTISAGEASGAAKISAAPIDDEIDNDSARIRITGSADGFEVTQAIVTIVDNDEPAGDVTLTLSQDTVGEDAGETELTVTGTLNVGAVRTEETEITLSVEGVSIPAEIEGEPPSVAASESDFTAPGVTLTIPAGQRSGTATVTITPEDDNLAEGPETAQVSGESDDLNVTAAQLTIEDNDQDASGIRLSVSPASVTEKDGDEEIAVTETLTGGAARPAATAVLVTVDGVSATSGADYTAPSTRLTIPAGQLSGAANVSITLIDDELDEPNEEVAIRGTNEDPGLTVTGARVSIIDDDLAPTGIVLSVNMSAVPEGGGFQRVEVTAEIQGNARSGATVVSLAAASGTAIHSQDFNATTGVLSIPAGRKSGTAMLGIAPIDDRVDEGDETLSIRGSTTLRSLNVQSASITITDDDTAGVAITPNTLTIDEGASGSHRVALLTKPSEQVTVTVTGQTGTDLTLDKTTLTFTTSNWGTPQAVTVTAGPDTDGADDPVTLTHTAAGGEYDSVTADLAVTVVDSDRAIVLTPSSLTVEEEDATGETYTVKLATEPSEEVTVTVTGQSGTDLTLTGLSTTNTLTFTTDNWDTAQTVTVKAAGDTDGANDEVTLTHTAAGGNYEDVTADLAVTVDDDETVSVVLSKTSLSVTEEDATGETYTVKLATEPSEEVTVTVTGQSGTDLTLTGLSGTHTLTFTTSNWNTAQPVTVTAGNDTDGADDPVTLTHTAAGGEYASVTATLPVTVLDNDRAIVLTPTSLTVDEDDATGETYTVKLATEPSEEVTVTVTGQSGTELTLTGLSATNTLTFTTSNWDTAQTVTVTAGHDTDGADDSETLTHTAAGGNYEDVTADLAVTVDDDETVAVVLSETSLSVTEEDATGSSYTVKLSHQPSEQVTVTVTGQSGTELALTGLSATNTLIFTTSNWNTAQTVTVKAGDDADGTDDPVTLTHTAAGGEYDSLTADLAVTVVDNDRAIVLSPSSLEVEEEDATGETYTVKLATEPSEEVTITVSGHSGTEVSVDDAELTFSTSNWDTAQTVTVKAAGDTDGADEKVTLTHTAAGGNYAGETAELAVTVDDDETVAVVLSETSLSVTEEDATGETYTVKLSHQPSAQVTVTVTGQSGTELTLDKTTLTFTTSNWNTAQSVTVKATGDTDGADDPVTLRHTASGGEYDSVTATLAVTVVDDDRAIVLTPSSLEVEEEDATGETYTVKLATEPSEEVTITVSGHSGTEVSVDDAELTFTTSNWNTAQTVTVKAAGDTDGANDEVTLTHTAAGGNYAGVTADLAVTVDDDETVSVVLSETALSVTEEDATGETYTVKLSHQPSEQVTVTVTGHTGTDLTLDKTTLTFTTSNWDTTQTVTVKATNDTDGADDPVTLTHTAAGGEYDSVTATLPVTVVDNDRAIVLTPSSLTVEEEDTTGETYTVKLATQPSEEVTVTITGQSGTEVSVDDAELTFTTSNWDTAQTVTVKAAGDADGANDEVTLTHTAAGGNYAGVTATLAVTVDDNETVSVVLSKSSLSVTEEDATGETYTVKLSHQPSEQVTVTVTGQSGTELTLDKTALTFTTSNWNTAQPVTVKATNDADGVDDPVTLTHTAAGGEYQGATTDLSATVVDNDRAIVLTPTSLTVEEEDAAGETYTVKLATEPSEEVTVTITGQSGTEVSVDDAELTFTTSNWNTAQTATVKAAGDTDGVNDEVTLTHTAAGGNYAGVTADLAVTVDEDETVAVVLSKTSLSVTEEDAAGETYTVKLSHQPSQQVTVTVTGQSGTDLTLDKTTLTFTTSNWDTAQSVTVKATGDADGADDPVTLTHTASGGEYASVTADLAVTVVDNDRAIVLTPSSLTVEEEDAAGVTYTVKLATEPSEEVTVTVTGQSGTDLTLDKTSLTFTTSNWNAAQTVTVTAGHDTDGADDSETLTHTAAGGNYAGVTADLAVTVDDDETVAVVLSKSSLSVTEEDTTGHTYTAKLATEPSEEVTVTITGQTGTELTLDKTALTFTTSNWNTVQTVTVKATNDTDGADDPVTLTHTASGGEYDSVTATLPVTVTDNDRAIVLTPSSLTVGEEDATGVTYTVKLATEPSEEVTVTITGQSGTEVSVDYAELTFTTDTWNTTQTVTVTATDESDDSVTLTLTHTAAGGNYEGVTADLAVTVDDDETGGRQPSRQVPGSGPVTNCDDADQYWEEDVEVDNNGQELPDQANNADGYVSLLQVGQTLEGYIGPCDDWDLFRFELEEDKYYRVDFLGSSTLDGTLRYPNIIAFLTDGPDSHHFRTEAEPVWYRHSDGKRPFSVFGDNSRSTDTVWVDPGAERQDNWGTLTESNSLGGVGENARQYLMHFPAGTYYVALIGGYNIGTYRIRLTEASDDDTGIRTLTLGDETTGSLDFVADKDVFDLELVAGKTYDISIQKKEASWRFSSAPFVSRVEDVDASTETNFPFTGETAMRHFTFYAATTGNHRFTVKGFSVADRYFADGEYGLTVTEHVFAPSAPRNLTVSSLTHDSVTLTWEAPEDSVVESYQVLRRFLDDQEFGDHHGSTKFVPIADDISSAETTYTDTSVEPRTRYVYRVKARNAGGLGEMSSYADAVTLSDNRAATGMPIITGPPTVGRTLTADTTGIDDANGLDDVSFSYQWLADDADISGATGNRYTLTDSEEGKAIKVRVSFTDDEGNEESLTSAATAAVSAAVAGVPRTVAVERGGTGELDVTWEAPASNGGSAITGYTVQWKVASGSWATDVSEATTTDTSYTITSLRLQVEYAVRVIATNSAGDGPASVEVRETADAQTAQQKEASENTPATGAPTISGILEAGQSLNADTSSISDDDGLTKPAFVYQWLSDDTDIAGATSATYLVMTDDVGKTIKVRVSFTDDAENEESLTSAATAAVSAAVPSVPLNVAVERGGTGELDVSWVRPDSDGGSEITGYTVQWKESSGSWDTAADVSEATVTDTSYTITGLRIQVEYAVRVIATNSVGDGPASAEVKETADAQTAQQKEASENTPATGAPTISGILEAGQSLNADTSSISDDDGLDDAIYAYQWLADDADIAGATSATYLVMTDDVGKTIKVRVSFIDDVGNEESLTSAATAAVSAAVPSVPLNVAVERGGTGELDVSWVRPDSDGGSEITGYTVQWKEASGSWDTSADVSEATVTDTSYTITGLSLQVEYAVRVFATNSAGDGPASAEVKETADAQTSQQQGPVKKIVPVTQERNTLATGAPSIVGTLVVGQTLSVNTSSISDDDGLDNATFVYQWLSDDTDISGATGSAYILADSDQGKAVKVRVSFTDDAGNEETLTSEALVVPVRPHGLTATTSDGDVVLTWNPPVGFSYLYDYQILRNRPELGEAEPLVFANTGTAETTYTDTDVGPGVLYVYRVKAASYFARFTEASEPVEIRTAEAAANTPATGAPAISGDLVAGQTLSADTSAIEDDDGLTNPAFVYQWLADDTSISGATDSRYTLVDSDGGKAIKVTVSFTDDAGNEESLTSAATSTVAAAATPLTADFLDTPSSHDEETPFTFELRFSEEFELSYTTLRDHAFTVTGGEVDGARRLDRDSATPNIRWEITVAPDGNGGVTVALPATTDCTAQGAICTGDGKMLSGEVTVTVGGSEGEEQQTPLENTPATGAPTISGTAGVGETLTADTSGIADSDGTDKAAFAYQWLADDADISGATGNRYTLTDSEEAKAIKVQVSFTDDEGNEESLTSDATAAVEAAPVADTLVSFTLVDTSDHSEVATLADGMSVTLDEPANGSYGIRVEVAAGAEVGSVFFELTGPKTASQTENIEPYSLYGDDGTDLNGEGLPAGSYTLRATAYSESGGGGDVLQALEVSFTVSDS